MIHAKIFMLLIAAYILTACAAVGVPVTSDPYKKLSYATTLYQNQDRAIPAERLIIEAIDIFKKDNDTVGLATAYRDYAFFIQSASVGNYAPYFKKNGFRDPDITFNNRYSDAIMYFNKSLDIFKEQNKYDSQINVNLAMGMNYHLLLKDPNKACDYFNQSLASYHKYIDANPGGKVAVPSQFNSFEEYFSQVQSETGCK